MALTSEIRKLRQERKALRQDPAADREKRIRFAAGQTWDDVAAAISGRIQSVMRG